ncbi:MAG: YggS family pyridoxal phosphate-dependent enzyme [Flavobacteriales bacterium]|nr:YggS family pyridoxal phosphate-dependent enzyme [Flavobacteriales bacterium]|tara:strand:+ start:56642 stop:57310 length:669 start_codon:yes stop_codon:yes gene_type:complete
MDIAANLKKIKEELGKATLVAVSKTKPKEDIQAAYDAGQRVFGENKAREMEGKAEALPDDIQWHMIGHLQSNKVKYIAPFVSLIHSVDKLKLLKEINKRAKQNERVIDVLLQIHIAKEESKFGMDEEEVRELLQSDTYKQFKNIRVVGLMGMATLTEHQDQIKSEFNYLNSLFQQIKKEYFSEEESFKILSMGMSGDYKIALSCGSTMVRIGSAIFGEREYH